MSQLAYQGVSARHKEAMGEAGMIVYLFAELGRLATGLGVGRRTAPLWRMKHWNSSKKKTLEGARILDDL